MAHKTAKQKRNHQLPNENQGPKSWPNLPHELLSLLERQPNLMQNITSFGGVAKSWRSPSRQCSSDGKARWPQLVEIDQKHPNNARRHVIEISFHEEYPYPYYKRRSYEKYWYPGKYFRGHSHGQIVVMGENLSTCSLWKPARQCSRYLPNWDRKIAFKGCTLSAFPGIYPNDRFNVMVLTGSSSPAFTFYRWGEGPDGEWILQDCNVNEPYSPSQNMQFTNAIGFQGKFYALSLQGSVVVIEDVDSCFRITGIGGNRAVPQKVSRQFREYLVESDGEILLVFLISRKSINVVVDVEVFRLDIPRLLWVKSESLGDRALFLEDGCCMWVTADKVRCKKNCIYFTHDKAGYKWWIFDMETGQISPTFETDSKIWDEPMEPE